MIDREMDTDTLRKTTGKNLERIAAGEGDMYLYRLSH